ncbi:MAG: anti-sigma factor [Pseudanabaena sp.]|nr:MAG: anti-sigma factor [Pseudanabaena sp.]
MRQDEVEVSELFGLTAIEAICADDMEYSKELAANYPESELELRSLRNAAAAIAYATTPLKIPTNLKQRLFNRIQQDADAPNFIARRANELQWESHTVKGLLIAVLNTDPFKREVSSLVRAEVTVKYPLHHHASGEEIYMLEGELIDNNVTYKAGDYLYSAAGSNHAPIALAGCKFFVRTSLDDTFL